MRAGELNVKLSATGGDQVKRELDKTKEAMRETKKEAASATDIIDGFGAATGGLGPIIDNVVSRVGRISSSIGSLGVIGGIATAAIGALAIGFGALQYQTYKFAFDARAAGMDFEAMRQRLEGLTGSAERAASILAVARREAGPSMFTTKQLEEAAVGLAAYGINVERTIPLVTRLGQAFGADQEHLMMYVRAFGQLKQGRLPESEVMGQMGIGRRDLMREGIQFDKSGQLLSSAEATMVAFEKIIYAKFDSAYKKSADTSQAIRASITDAFEDIQRTVGTVVNETFKDFEKGLGSMVAALAKSDFPRLVTEDLMRPFRMLTGVFADAQDAFAVFVAGLGATVNIIPGMISRTIELFDKLRTGNLQEKALAVLQMRQGLGGAAALAGKDFAARFREYYESLKYQMAAPADVMGTIGQDRSRERFGGDEPLADAGKKADKKQTQTHLQRIEANTRKSADLLDLRNQTIGGGRLAGLGITGPEFAGMGMRVQSDFSRAKPISADTMVNRGIKTMIQNNLGFAVNGGRTMPVR
jgi:hypothetical protein